MLWRHWRRRLHRHAHRLEADALKTSKTLNVAWHGWVITVDVPTRVLFNLEKTNAWIFALHPHFEVAQNDHTTQDLVNQEKTNAWTFALHPHFKVAQNDHTMQNSIIMCMSKDLRVARSGSILNENKQDGGGSSPATKKNTRRYF